jgi:hypothetical protein
MSEVITLEKKEQPLTWEEIQSLVAKDDPTDFIKANQTRRNIQTWNGVIQGINDSLPANFTMVDLIEAFGEMQQEIENLQEQIDAWECWRDESPY